MNLKSKRVFLTGAEGFIGSHLAERLVRDGATVKAMIQYNSFGSLGNLELLPKDILKSIEIFPGDIRDPFNVDEGVKNNDIVMHLAALIAIPYSYVAPQSYIETNVNGTLNILQACRRHSVEKIVHTSTSETFGTAMYVPIDEKHPLQGQSPYSASKIGADKIAESFYLSYQLPVTTLRPFNTYGPRQSARAVIPAIISQVLAGKKEIHLGSLAPVRDFTFVTDTVEAFIAIVLSPQSIGETINCGTGKAVSIGELAHKVIKIIGKDDSIKIVTDHTRIRPEKSEVMTLLCNANKARELCNWKPTVSLDEGLQLTIDFVRQQLSKFRVDIFNV